MRVLYGLVVCSFVLFMAPSVGHAQEDAAAAVAVPVNAPQPDGDAVGALTAPTAETASGPQPQAPGATTPQNSVPPVEHTGLATLGRDTLHDFKAFPTRESTWVILGVGGALAAAVHPADEHVNEHLVSSGTADKIWKPGHIIGGPVMFVVPVAIYLGGRYVLPEFDHDEDRTNKWSHVGLDLVRAEILDEVIVQGVKVSVRRYAAEWVAIQFPVRPRGSDLRAGGRDRAASGLSSGVADPRHRHLCRHVAPARQCAFPERRRLRRGGGHGRRLDCRRTPRPKQLCLRANACAGRFCIHGDTLATVND